MSKSPRKMLKVWKDIEELPLKLKDVKNYINVLIKEYGEEACLIIDAGCNSISTVIEFLRLETEGEREKRLENDKLYEKKLKKELELKTKELNELRKKIRSRK